MDSGGGCIRKLTPTCHSFNIILRELRFPFLFRIVIPSHSPEFFYQKSCAKEYVTTSVRGALLTPVGGMMGRGQVNRPFSYNKLVEWPLIQYTPRSPYRPAKAILSSKPM